MNSPGVFGHFQVEARELLEQLGRGFASLLEGAEDARVVPQMFRWAHTLKGAALGIGAGALAQACAAAEAATEPDAIGRQLLVDRVRNALDAVLADIAAYQHEQMLRSLKGPRGVFASLFQRLSSTDEDRLNDLLKLIRLDGKRHWKAGLLAHGEKQWLEIGMLLSQEPKVLLVDEPAAGMTDEETHRTGELLISLAGKHSIIVIEHDMAFVRQIARDNNVTVLHQGSVLCEGKFDEVQSNPKVREVYLGRGKHGNR